MARQSAFFCSAQLHRTYDLAGPTAASRTVTRKRENADALVGMRRPDRSYASSPSYADVGAKLSHMLDAYIAANPSTLEVISGLRAGHAVQGMAENMPELRTRWLSTLAWPPTAPVPRPDACVIEAWGQACNGPDAARILPSWLRAGAPIGVVEHVETAGVFPSIDSTETMDPLQLSSVLAGWANYASAEAESEVVAKLLGEQEAKGHCKFFDSKPDMLQYFQVPSVVLTKLALISKVKTDGTTKHWLIWDLLRSNVISTVVSTERIVLPRIQDAVDDARQLLRRLSRTHPGALEWLVLDVADAFHNIPLRPTERRYACGKIGDKFVVFLVFCMGGKSAPTIWGRFAAAIGRILASIADASTFRVEAYVDDPLLAAAGSLRQSDHIFTRALLALSVLGFPLAWAKASMGQSVVWIGAQLSVTNRHDTDVVVSIPQDKLDALRSETAGLRSKAVVPRRHVRSYCGKISFVAGMVPILRPFLGMFWAALASSSSLPAGLIHCRQFRIALQWMSALMAGIYGPLTRRFALVEPCADEGDYIATDACPWGFAGVLFTQHIPVALVRDRRFQAKVGDCAHNTTWEALAILVAIRIWLPGTTALASVKSDSLSALRSMVRISGRSPALNLNARELALDTALGLYKLGIASHISGVSNKLPEDLSRMWAPDPHAFPNDLRSVPEAIAPARDAHFWKAATSQHRGGHRASSRR